MILFALGCLLLFIFAFSQKHFIYALVLFFALFDMFDGFYKDNQIFAAVRYVVPLTLILFYVFKYNILKSSDTILLILISYLLILLVYTPGDRILSFKIITATIITFLMIPIGRHFAKEIDFVSGFEKYNRFLLIVIPIYIICANIFHIGESYSETFTTGFLITSRMYLAPIVIFLAIHYVITSKNSNLLIKLNDILFILINICLLIVITRRTSIGMVAGAMVIYALLNRKLFFKMMMMIFFLIAVLIFSYPLYEKQLNAQLEERERIQDIDTYEEEGRYLETKYILEFFDNRARTTQVLFGDKPFDTIGFGLSYFGHERAIHSDINMVLYSTGLVGLLLFSLLVIKYFVVGITYISEEDKRVYYPLLFMFLIVLLPGRFIGTLTFAPLLMLLLSASKYHHGSTEPLLMEEESVYSASPH